MTDLSKETPENGDRLDRLISLATGLNDEIEQLSSASGRQFVSLARSSRNNRRMIIALIASVALDVVLTIVLSLVGVGMVENTNRIDALTKQLNTDNTDQRRRALCPLYGVFLDSKSPQGRAAAPDPAKYDHAFEVIEDGYRVLGCDTFLKESGKNQW